MCRSGRGLSLMGSFEERTKAGTQRDTVYIFYAVRKYVRSSFVVVAVAVVVVVAVASKCIATYIVVVRCACSCKLPY